MNSVSGKAAKVIRPPPTKLEILEEEESPVEIPLTKSKKKAHQLLFGSVEET